MQVAPDSLRRAQPLLGTTRSAIIAPCTRHAPGAIKGVSVRAPSCALPYALTKIAMIDADAWPHLSHYGASRFIALADDDVRVSSNWHGYTLAA